MGEKNKKSGKTIFESLRKPTAPPSRTIGNLKPEEKIHPSRRKTKHKKKEDITE